MNKVKLAILALFTIGISLFSEDMEKQPKNWGFIFNTSNIFLDIESYQAGIGGKVYLKDDLALRLLADGFYSSSTDTFSMSLGGALEKHLFMKRVSPYWGGFAEFGYMVQKDEDDDENWTKNISLPMSAGAILGVELFIVANVSLFAEYNVVFEGSILNTVTSVDGQEDEGDREFAYKIDTGIGNESMLGICIYLDDVVKLDL